MVQVFRYVTRPQPSMLCVSSFPSRPVDLSRHTALGIALVFHTHVMTVGSASPGVAKAEEREENESERTSSTDNAKTWEDVVCVG